MTAQPPADGTSQPWEQFLRQLLGPAADDAIEQLRASGVDPSALASASGLPTDPATMAAVFSQVNRLMEESGDEPVNWPVAHDLARQTAATGGDPTPTADQVRATVDALAVAELWLDAATDLPPAVGQRRAWSRAEWVEATLPAWRTLTEPVATSMSTALGDLLSGQLPEEVGVDTTSMVRRLGSAVFGLQVGQAAGTLAREAFGTTDLGLPLLEHTVPALVPANVLAFAEGLDAPASEVQLFLALREAAAARLFAGVPWLRGWLASAVDAYARGIAIDPEQLEEAVREVDLNDPGALQEALSGGVFAPHTTPAQQAALLRLETGLALVEGWVDEVSAAAAAPHLPHAVALREMLRRRRAAGGPAEHTFATLVGLELRPRRLREAARLWAAIAADGGPGARDAVWNHPDLMPTTEDLDDPDGYTARTRAAVDEAQDLDRALADILGPEDPPAV
ncbi:MAG: zinc-dependent metalloprotease [Cellulomonas sp.]|nr:zinc-dependent metalloprotease [Cellulomonas sp.]